MGENKDRKFITERILGRELTLGRTLKFVFVSLLCGLVFGAAAGTAVFFVSRYVAAEEQKQRESEALSEAAAAVTEELAVTEVPEEEGSDSAVTEAPVMEESGSAEPEPVLSESDVPEPVETVPAEGLPGETAESSLDEENMQGEDDPGTQMPASGEEPAAGPDGDAPESTVPESPALDEEAVRRIVTEAEAERVLTDEDLEQLYALRQSAVEKIAHFIVRVDCTISETTWFESTVETKRSYSGVILSVEEDEILILTVTGAKLEHAALSVVFSDGTRGEAVIKQASDRDGFMTLAVSTEGLGSDFIGKLEAVETAETGAAKAGLSVVAAGAPSKAVNSVYPGFITFVETDRSIVDGSISRCYCSAGSHPETGTWLFTEDGRLLGLGMETGEEEADADGSCFLLTASCTSLLESLKKGYSLAYLGVTGTDISFDMKYTNIPEGFYITDVEEESPAAAAGLKRGDIITASGTREIRGLSDFCSFMRNLRPEEKVTVTIRRLAGVDEYKELELELTAGSRQAE